MRQLHFSSRTIRVARLLVVISALLTTLAVFSATADAQQLCEEGTLVGERCEIVGDPPAPGPPVCAPGHQGTPQDGCYSVSDPVDGDCPPGSVLVGDECRRPEATIDGPLQCEADFTREGNRCVRYVQPTCGAQGCFGSITLTYTVDCVGEGVGRVNLGRPQLVNGATVSLITVNGSATVGADLAGGTQIVVVITPERAGDAVVVRGPDFVPACASATPTPAPTSTPRPAAPRPTKAPAPTATAAPTTEATPTPSTDPEPTVTPSPTMTPDPTATPSPSPTVVVIRETQCETDEALIAGECLPPCPTTLGPCYEVPDGSTTNSTIQIEPDPSSDGGAPVLALATIAGITVVLSVAAYATLANRRPPW